MKTPDLILEQIYLKEKSAADIPPETLALSSGTIRRSNEEILRRYPAADMKKAVAEKLASGSRAAAERPAIGAKPLRFPTGRAVSWAAAACCLALLTFVAVNTATTGSGAAGFDKAGNFTPALAGERVKGNGPRLIVYKKDGDTALPLQAETRVAENDRLQLSYIAGGDTYGAILSVDGNGVVTQHFPDSGDLTAKLESGGEISLDFSYKLDDAPKFERFFFITGKEQFSLADLKHALSRSALDAGDGEFTINDRLPGQAHAADILLRK